MTEFIGVIMGFIAVTMTLGGVIQGQEKRVIHATILILCITAWTLVIGGVELHQTLLTSACFGGMLGCLYLMFYYGRVYLKNTQGEEMR